MRSGHGPFNTPERFRGKSTVGILGDMTLETDEIIGKMWDSLENTNKINNTVKGGQGSENSFMKQ